MVYEELIVSLYRIPCTNHVSYALLYALLLTLQSLLSYYTNCSTTNIVNHAIACTNIHRITNIHSVNVMQYLSKLPNQTIFIIILLLRTILYTFLYIISCSTIYLSHQLLILNANSLVVNYNLKVLKILAALYGNGIAQCNIIQCPVIALIIFFALHALCSMQTIALIH